MKRILNRSCLAWRRGFRAYKQRTALRLSALFVLTAVAMAVLNSCSDSGQLTAGGPYELNVATNPSFEAGSTMDKLSKAQKITVGTKFDQPLFAQK
ncbi:MAG TPA: hypothetical protein VIT23_11230, partial [Terrimicrobiaceae bacterium]